MTNAKADQKLVEQNQRLEKTQRQTEQPDTRLYWFKDHSDVHSFEYNTFIQSDGTNRVRFKGNGSRIAPVYVHRYRESINGVLRENKKLETVEHPFSTVYKIRDGSLVICGDKEYIRDRTDIPSDADATIVRVENCSYGKNEMTGGRMVASFSGKGKEVGYIIDNNQIVQREPLTDPEAELFNMTKYEFADPVIKKRYDDPTDTDDTEIKLSRWYDIAVPDNSSDIYRGASAVLIVQLLAFLLFQTGWF